MAKSTPEMPNLLIAVVGDVFREKYLVPISKPDAVAPFTWPDSLRGQSAVYTGTVSSGVLLHAAILKHILNQYANIRIAPDPDDLSSDDLAFGRDYLHHLAPFPADLSADSKKVWRISQTYGLCKDLPIPPPKNNLPQFESRVLKELQKTADQDATVILLVNDRGLGFRSSQNDKYISALFKSLKTYGEHVASGRPLRSNTNNLLIIWHPRNPDLERNRFYEVLADSDFKRNTLVVLNQQCLRDEGVNIRFDISYEHTLTDLLTFSARHPLLKSLLYFPQILIRHDYGVLHLTSDMRGRILSADAHGMVGGPFYISSSRFGITPGRTFTLLASLIREIVRWHREHHSTADLLSLFAMENPAYAHPKSRLRWPSKYSKEFGPLSTPSLLRGTVLDLGIDLGILLNAHHFYTGFGDYDPYTDLPPEAIAKNSMAKHYADMLLHFDDNVVRSDVQRGQALGLGDREFAFQHREASLTRLARFSLNSELLGHDPSSVSQRSNYSRVDLLGIPKLINLARARDDAKHRESDDSLQPRNETFEAALSSLVICGAVATIGRKLRDDVYTEPSFVLPFVEFGSLITFDRDEIDGFLSIKFLIERYLDAASPSTPPLSVAVFGPPGAGKSFVVKQILKSVGKDRQMPTFNLSQFTSLSELSRVFHRIQDRALAGEIPVTFFDEFDSSMDGKPLAWLKFFLSPMQDGEYFDGHDTYRVGPAVFVFGGGTAYTFTDFVEKHSKRRLQKAPDFISRLRGHLNVSDVSALDDKVDKRLQVRRALLLRSLLQEHAPNIFVGGPGGVAEIDRGIITAFLHVKKYRHGARSMSAIIKMSNILDAKSFQRSALPTLAQLGMHVNAREFQDLVNSDRGRGTKVRK